MRVRVQATRSLGTGENTAYLQLYSLVSVAGPEGAAVGGAELVGRAELTGAADETEGAALLTLGDALTGTEDGANDSEDGAEDRAEDGEDGTEDRAEDGEAKAELRAADETELADAGAELGSSVGLTARVLGTLESAPEGAASTKVAS